MHHPFASTLTGTTEPASLVTSAGNGFTLHSPLLTRPLRGSAASEHLEWLLGTLDRIEVREEMSNDEGYTAVLAGHEVDGRRLETATVLHEVDGRLRWAQVLARPWLAARPS